ncbi:MAG: carbohydrate kinase [Deltaproteobacteria bacterium]|nr:carbohydrate kinase [Deltaproteobacteria bacterium]
MIKRINSPLVVGIGELLWDIFPDGKQMGGAPANVIYHVKHTGCEGYVISLVGNDDLGKSLISEMEKCNLSDRYVGISDLHPTGTVTVKLDKKGMPAYKINENVAWDYLRIDDKNLNLVKEANAICFGSLAQRSNASRNTIISLLKESSDNALKVFDLNLRQNYYNYSVIDQSLEMCNILKLNEDELKELTVLFELTGTIDSRLKYFSENYNLDLIALTKGARSSILYTPEERSELPSPNINISDTVGAGDCFTAIIIAGILKNMPLNKIHRMAVDMSAWVCTKQGATPEYTLEQDIYRLY